MANHHGKAKNRLWAKDLQQLRGVGRAHQQFNTLLWSEQRVIELKRQQRRKLL